jgi:hypothetical protein
MEIRGERFGTGAVDHAEAVKISTRLAGGV